MTTIAITRTDLRPFDTVEGRVTWRLEKAPRDLELRLCWFTRGRGTEESEPVASLPLGDTVSGERVFSFPLPDQPWSVDGSLIRIAWALEVVAKKSGALAVEEIVVSPERREIRLGKEDSSAAGRIERWFRRLNREKR